MHKRNSDGGDTALALTVEETARMMRIGMTKVYALIAAKELPARKIGRRTIILREDLEAYLRSLSAAA
jgi:excisionase family DNA binding protein